MHHVKSLGYFVAVAQSKSIREAAERLHLTSSALNRHILDLEDTLGAPLFERHARGIRLNSAGESYLLYARRALRDADEAQARIDELRGLRRGKIQLASVAATADARLMDLIATFQREFPKIGFSLSVMGAEDVVRAVLQHEADLGIAFNPAENPEFHRLADRGYSMHAIVTREHPLADRPVLSIHELAAWPLAMADRSWGGRRLLDEYLVKTGLKLRPQLESNAFDVLTQFIRRNQGVCFQIRPGPGTEALEHGLVALPIAELRRYERRMVLGSLRGRVLPVAAALFGETLKRELFPLPCASG